MKRLFLFLPLLIVGCIPFNKTPDAVPTVTARQSAPLATAQQTTNTATSKADAASENVTKQRDARDSKIKASVTAARQGSANSQFVDAELGLVESALADVAIDAAEFDAANARKGLFDSGQVEAARKAYGQATTLTQKAGEALTVAKSQYDQAVRERDAARTAEAVATKTLMADLKRNQELNQKALDDQKLHYEAELEKERQSFLKLIGKILIGLGVVLTLIGVFVVYSGVQSGDPFKSIVKAAAFGGGAAFCYSCAWAMGQWWFKWFVIGGLSLIVIAIVFYLWSEWREGQEKKQLIQRSREADEAESVAKKMIEVIDTTPEVANPIKTKLGTVMDLKDKAVVHELRAEEQRAKSGT